MFKQMSIILCLALTACGANHSTIPSTPLVSQTETQDLTACGESVTKTTDGFFTDGEKMADNVMFQGENNCVFYIENNTIHTIGR